MGRILLACVLLVFAAAASSMQIAPSERTQAIVKTVHIEPLIENASRYMYVPFDVPANVTQIEITYEYDRANGENTLDIGLFDPRSHDVANDTGGFRGWSGGRRSNFYLSEESATPGYIAGKVQPGVWNVILGLYRVSSKGVDVKFDIKLTFDGNAEQSLTPPSARSLPWLALSQSKTIKAVDASPQKRRWVSGDLHMHTVHSDGDWTIPNLINNAIKADLDFIAVSDHNTYSHHREIDQQNATRQIPLIIRGEEITTYGGHANAWGLPSGTLIDFRITPGDMLGMNRLVDEAHRLNALISINHPFALCAGCSWSYGLEAQGFHAIEVWNGAWDVADESALKSWDGLLRSGRHITAIASSDSHREANALGQPTSQVEIDRPLIEQNLLTSIKAGHVYLTAVPKTPSLTFEGKKCQSSAWTRIGDTIDISNSELVCFKIDGEDLPIGSVILLISDGLAVESLSANKQSLSRSLEVRVNRSSYYRLEVRGEGGKMLALTNPIYVESKRSRATKSTSHY